MKSEEPKVQSPEYPCKDDPGEIEDRTRSPFGDRAFLPMNINAILNR